jgi:hypothetical protein
MLRYDTRLGTLLPQDGPSVVLPPRPDPLRYGKEFDPSFDPLGLRDRRRRASDNRETICVSEQMSLSVVF